MKTLLMAVTIIAFAAAVGTSTGHTAPDRRIFAMRKVLALAAIMALLGCAAARAEPTQSDCTSETQLELRGTIIQTKITRHKYVAIALDTPICGNSVIRVWKVPVKWLGHHVIIDATPSSDETWLVSSIKEAGDTADNIEKLSCRDIVGKGWDHMPSMSDYVLAQPGADKLKGSGCNIDSLVFAQCFLEPKWSVSKAVSALLRKAATGKKLPDIPMCGA